MNQISFQSVYQTITARGEFKLGQRAMTPDGREWQFVKAATEAMGSGAAVVPVAAVSADLFSSSSDQQGRIVYATRAASTMTVGAYEDWIGIVDEGTGLGQSFKIKTNNATTFTLYPENAFGTALAVGSSDLTWIGMSNVELAAVTSKLQMCQGGIQVSFASGDYGWVLTNGDGRALAGDTSLLVGTGFSTGDDVEGQVDVAVITEGALTAQNLGYTIVANGASDIATLVRWITR